MASKLRSATRRLRLEQFEQRVLLSADGLSGHWTFDDADVIGDTVADVATDPLGPFDGLKTNGGPATGVTGVVGQAAEFGGGPNNGDYHYVDLAPNAPAFGNFAEGTIAAWIKPDNTGLTTNVLTIFSVSNVNAGSEEMRFWVSYDPPVFGVGTLAYGVRAGTANGTIVSNSTNLLDGQWHHVAVTVDDLQTAQLYIDGMPDGPAGAISFMTDLQASGSAIGRNKDTTGGGGQWFFDGLMDDVGLWHDALTSAEIQAIVNLAQHPSLNYDLGIAQSLFDLNDNAGGSLLIGSLSWNYADSGLFGAEGELVDDGGNSYSINLGGGRGVRTGAPPLLVIATDPADGSTVAPGLTSITVDLSLAVSAASLDASDLTVDGTPAVGVVAVDADTVRFNLAGGIGGGTHTVRIAAGVLETADGELVHEYTGQFTIPAPPTVVTLPASGVGANLATLAGEILDTGQDTPEATIYWGTTDAGANPTAWQHQVDLGTVALGSFSTELAGLQLGTTYYYRAYASNLSGGAWAPQSESFTTLAAYPPVLITELMADNNDTLRDGIGRSSDWIELHNPGSVPVNLAGWHLTDNATNLTKWTFPSQMLAAGDYLVVFASSSDDAPASGEELHTSFSLSAGGEYVALVWPNGSTIASEYGPGGSDYPNQFEDVSYGVEQRTTRIELVSNPTSGKFLVPENDGLEATWAQRGFDDAAWTPVTAPVGYDATSSASGLLAYWDFDIDAAAGGTVADVADTATPHDGLLAGDAFTSAGSLNLDGDGDYVELGDEAELEGLPAMTVAAWVRTDELFTSLRRIVEHEDVFYFWSQNGQFRFTTHGSTGPSGSLHIVGNTALVADEWMHVAATIDATGAYLYVNGVEDGSAPLSPMPTSPHPMQIGARRSAGGNATNFWEGQMDDVAIWNRALSADEVAQLAAGTLPPDVGLANTLGTDVRDLMYDVNSSAYLRVPFTLDQNPAELDALELNVRYDDALVVYLNGQEVARRGVDGNVGWNTTASEELGSPATEQIDLSAHIDKLVSGDNVLAIQIVNASADDMEVLIVPELVAVDHESIDPTEQRYLLTPTPGERNGEGARGLITEEVAFSTSAGTFTDAFDLMLLGSRVGAEIHYTTDGTIPTAESSLYTDPISVDATTQIRARLIAPDLAPGPINSETFVHLDADVETFTSPLPIIVIENFGAGTIPDKSGGPNRYGGDGTGVVQVERQPASMTILEQVDGISSLTNQTDLSTRIGIRVRGTSSAREAKKGFSVETWGDVDDDVNMSVLGMPAESDWILYAPTVGYDYPLIHNTFMYEVSNQTGNYAVRTQFVEVFISTSGDSVAMSDHVGLYVFMEKVKRDGDRVNFDELSPDGTQGGWMLKSDRMDAIPPGGEGTPQFFHTAGPDRILQMLPNQNGNLGDDIPTSYNTFLNFESPNGYEINPVQRQTIEDWFYEFEEVLYGPDFMDPDSGYAAYIDIDSLIDHLILNIMSKNRDGLQLSTYLYKTSPEAKLTFGPIWDFDRAFNTTSMNQDPVEDLDFHKQFLWLPRLFEDPNFDQRYTDRWQALREGPLATDNLFAIIDAQAAQITEEVAIRNGTPNWTGRLADMKNWISVRVEALDAQFTPKPTFNSEGGIVPAGFDLTITTQVIEETPVLWTESFGTMYIPTDDSLGTTWTEPGFDDFMWDWGMTGVGYEDDAPADYWDLLSYPDERPQDISEECNSIFIRLPFTIVDGEQNEQLTLRMQYDDGFVAYLNGEEVARRNVPDGVLNYDSNAASSRSDGQAVIPERIDISEFRDVLNVGENLLAIHVLNQSTDSSDLLMMPEVIVEKAVQNPFALPTYYTTDGTDPRLPDGSISPSAQFYNGTPVRIDESLTVKARTLDGTSWSGLRDTLFFVGVVPATADNLAITEINYNPHDPTPAELAAMPGLDNDDFEFIELQNVSAEPIDLTGVQFVDGVTFDFSAGSVTTLLPGEFVAVTRDPAAFQMRYGTVVSVAGAYDGGIRNSGEQIILADHLGLTIRQFSYDDSGDWPGRADGKGASLEVLDVAADYNSPANWRSSGEYGGTPGSIGEGLRLDVVVNEVLTHTDAPDFDAIELHNTTGATINIGGWYLSDDSDNFLKYKIPAGTTIPGGGYVVFNERDHFNPTPQAPGPNDFALSGAHGDHVWLMEADAPSNLVRFVDHVKFGAAFNGVSLGRWPDATGTMFPMEEATLGDENTAPLVGDVIISELHYQPAAPPAGSTITDAELEFVELFNRTSATVDLTGWRLDDGVDFTFADNTMISSGSPLVVVGFNPADTARATQFRTIHNVDASVPLLGPYSGRLENLGERVALALPDESPLEEPLFVPYVVVDELIYDNQAPWPVEAGGLGQSLHRTATDAFGNFAESWEAGTPSPGSTDLPSSYRHPGDANLDGATDLSDFNIWNAHKFNIGTDWTTGDFNTDGNTDLSDFNIWNAHKFTTAPAPPAAAAGELAESTAMIDDLARLRESQRSRRSNRSSDITTLADQAVDRLLATYWE